MNPELLHLRDIRGLDEVGWWPPALGWWLVLAALALLPLIVPLLLRGYRYWRLLAREDWRRDAVERLRALQRRVAKEEPKVVAAELSELLRRIAVARCGRDACAGLHGEAWVEWLADHDPHGFDWRRHTRLLLESPYAPPGAEEGEERAVELRELINATRAWARHPERCEVRRETSHGL